MVFSVWGALHLGFDLSGAYCLERYNKKISRFSCKEKTG